MGVGELATDVASSVITVAVRGTQHVIALTDRDTPVATNANMKSYKPM